MTTAMPRVARRRRHGVPDLVENSLQSALSRAPRSPLVEPTLGRRSAPWTGVRCDEPRTIRRSRYVRSGAQCSAAGSLASDCDDRPARRDHRRARAPARRAMDRPRHRSRCSSSPRCSPAASGMNVHVRWFPPLHAQWMPRIGPGTLAAIVLAMLAVDLRSRPRGPDALADAAARGIRRGSRLDAEPRPGRRLGGLATILDTQFEYLRTARAVTDVGALLREYIAHIPLDSPDNWPVHIAGHPPGRAAVLRLPGACRPRKRARGRTRRDRRRGDDARSPCCSRSGGSARRWARDGRPRSSCSGLRRSGCRSQPMRCSARSLPGVCARSPSPRPRGVRWRPPAGPRLAGLVLGYCVMLSYGLPLLGILAVAILVLARRWSPLPWAAGAAALVVLAFAAGGFAWWEAYPVLVERYWAGVATNRPFAYWVWANLAALAVQRRSARRRRGGCRRARVRRLRGAALAIAVDRRTRPRRARHGRSSPTSPE